MSYGNHGNIRCMPIYRLEKMATGSGHSSGASKRPPAKPVRYKLLSTCTLGGHELRFLSMNEANGAVSFPVTVEEVILFSSEKSATFPGQNGGFEQFKIRIYANAWNIIKFLLIFTLYTISGIIFDNLCYLHQIIKQLT